jgi:hypothetical protein
MLSEMVQSFLFEKFVTLQQAALRWMGLIEVFLFTFSFYFISFVGYLNLEIYFLDW